MLLEIHWMLLSILLISDFKKCVQDLKTVGDPCSMASVAADISCTQWCTIYHAGIAVHRANAFTHVYTSLCI